MTEYRLTDEQIAQYLDQGYVFLHDIFTLEEVQLLLDRIDGLLEGRYDSTGISVGTPPVRSDDDPSRLIKHVSPNVFPIKDAVLRYFGDHPVLKSIVTQLMSSSKSSLFQQQCLMKEPGYPNGTPWHQDDHYWKLDETGVTAWFPLEPISEANGTMYVFPETHKGEMLEHKSVVGESVFHTFNEQLDESKAIPVLLPLGSVSFHHKRLIHGAPANFGEIRRVAFAQHYKAVFSM